MRSFALLAALTMPWAGCLQTTAGHAEDAAPASDPERTFGPATNTTVGPLWIHQHDHLDVQLAVLLATENCILHTFAQPTRLDTLSVALYWDTSEPGTKEFQFAALNQRTGERLEVQGPSPLRLSMANQTFEAGDRLWTGVFTLGPPYSSFAQPATMVLRAAGHGVQPETVVSSCGF